MIKFDLSAHTCDACVICCMDFRIHSEQVLNSFLREQGIKTYDLVTIPGAGKALNDESSRQIILNAVKISLDLHKAKIIYIINHTDCGAYGGFKAFGSKERELDSHKHELESAKQIVQKEIGSFIPVKKFFFDSVNDPSNTGSQILKAVSVI